MIGIYQHGNGWAVDIDGHKVTGLPTREAAMQFVAKLVDDLEKHGLGGPDDEPKDGK